jgi:hypothetical protein
MTPECQAAVNALVITGMDQVEAEKIILDLHAALPAATGTELTLIALEAKKQPPVQSHPLEIVNPGRTAFNAAMGYNAAGLIWLLAPLALFFFIILLFKAGLFH